MSTAALPAYSYTGDDPIVGAIINALLTDGHADHFRREQTASGCFRKAHHAFFPKELIRRHDRKILKSHVFPSRHSDKPGILGVIQKLTPAFRDIHVGMVRPVRKKRDGRHSDNVVNVFRVIQSIF